jgi:hypothetical protein
VRSDIEKSRPVHIYIFKYRIKKSETYDISDKIN